MIFICFITWSSATYLIITLINRLALRVSSIHQNQTRAFSSTFSHAYTCDREYYKLATTVINSAELPELGNSVTLAVLDCNKPTSSSAFHPTEETKAVEINPTDPPKTVRIETKLLAK